MINILLKQLAHLIGYKVTWLSPCRSIDLDLHSLTELPVQRRNLRLNVACKGNL